MYACSYKEKTIIVLDTAVNNFQSNWTEIELSGVIVVVGFCV